MERVRNSHIEAGGQRRLIAGPPSPALCVCHHPPDSPPCYITLSRRPRFFFFFLYNKCSLQDASVSVCHLVLYSDFCRSKPRT